MLLYVHRNLDGYVYGATRHENGSGNRYWHPAGSAGCEPCLVELWELKAGTNPEPFIYHGTELQEFRDGYECESALHKHGTCIAVLHEHGEE